MILNFVDLNSPRSLERQDTQEIMRPKKFRDFRETGPSVVVNAACA